MTTFQLKVLAVVAMLADHIGLVFYPNDVRWRLVGRLAFPIFAYLIAVGVRHTSSKWRYLARLAALAAVSEVPFQLVNFGEVSLQPPTRNIFFTLLLGLAGISAFAWLQARLRLPGALLGFAVIAACAAAAWWLRTDYGYAGVVLIALLYLANGRKWALFLALVIGNSVVVVVWFIQLRQTGFLEVVLARLTPVDWLWQLRQLFAICAFVPIALYNGRPGPRLKWAFYFFYPAHLMALWLISQRI